jgi:hypothetical protein
MTEKNFVTRRLLMEMVDEDLSHCNKSLTIKKLNTMRKACTMGFKRGVNVQPVVKKSKPTINLVRLETVEDDLTCENTILESPIDNHEGGASSIYYKYLRELSVRVKNLFFYREKKGKPSSTVKLPTIENKIETDQKFNRNSLKRKSMVEVRGLAFMKLIPCLSENDFKINLIQCEKN